MLYCRKNGRHKGITKISLLRQWLDARLQNADYYDVKSKTVHRESSCKLRQDLTHDCGLHYKQAAWWDYHQRCQFKHWFLFPFFGIIVGLPSKPFKAFSCKL